MWLIVVHSFTHHLITRTYEGAAVSVSVNGTDTPFILNGTSL